MTLFTLYFILHTVHVALHNTARSVALNTAIMLMAAQVEGCSTGAMFSGLAWAMLTVNPTMGERGSQLFTEGSEGRVPKCFTKMAIVQLFNPPIKQPSAASGATFLF